jgi:hypothetical protein
MTAEFSPELTREAHPGRACARDQRAWVGGTLDETPTQIEAFGIFGNGVDENSGDAGCLRGLVRAQDRIAQKQRAKSPTLLRPMHRQLAKNNDGNWIRHVASQAARRLARRHGAGCQRIVGDYTHVAANHECP